MFGMFCHATQRRFLTANPAWQIQINNLTNSLTCAMVPTAHVLFNSGLLVVPVHNIGFNAFISKSQATMALELFNPVNHLLYNIFLFCPGDTSRLSVFSEMQSCLSCKSQFGETSQLGQCVCMCDKIRTRKPHKSYSRSIGPLDLYCFVSA